MDDEIQRSVRDDDLRASILLRRAGRITEALDRLEAACLGGNEDARGLLLETIAAVPAVERRAHATRLDRLGCRGIEAAERRWKEWFPAAARIVGRSAPMQNVRAFVFEHATSDAPIVIFGESGVGHHHTARVIHELSGGREFVIANVSAVAEGIAATLFENETRLLAEGDTLFTWYLDSGDSEDRAFQRARERGARLIVGAGPDPAQWSRRMEAYAGVLEIAPLRQRLDDLPLLVRFLLDRHGGAEFAVTEGLIERLRTHAFGGNVRELDNQLYVLMHLARSERRSDLPLEHLAWGR
jgi:transcriptional regulator of acetoin/glycerol metabolism